MLDLRRKYKISIKDEDIIAGVPDGYFPVFSTDSQKKAEVLARLAEPVSNLHTLSVNLQIIENKLKGLKIEKLIENDEVDVDFAVKLYKLSLELVKLKASIKKMPKECANKYMTGRVKDLEELANAHCLNISAHEFKEYSTLGEVITEDLIKRVLK